MLVEELPQLEELTVDALSASAGRPAWLKGAGCGRSSLVVASTSRLLASITSN